MKEGANDEYIFSVEQIYNEGEKKKKRVKKPYQKIFRGERKNKKTV